MDECEALTAGHAGNRLATSFARRKQCRCCEGDTVGHCVSALSKPPLKAPGTKRLKLQHDVPLSSYTFKFNSRRCTTGITEYKEFWREQPDAAEAGAYTRPLLWLT